jgi:uncharacterized damage-inducible protein DinB
MKHLIQSQFGAAIDMLENATGACPDELWADRSQQPEFWYLAFHTLFFLDLYLSDSAVGFAPPSPFTLSEMAFDGRMPERAYTKAELQTYLEHGRAKWRGAMDALGDENWEEPCDFGWMTLPRAELHLYNMRHVQHHAAQLNLILRQRAQSAPGWVARSRT